MKCDCGYIFASGKLEVSSLSKPSISLFSFYLECLRKYAIFTGRASRKEFWAFMLFYISFIVLFALAIAYLGALTGGLHNSNIASLLGIVIGLWFVAHLVPHIAVTVRRLHDTNRSGWWYLISFVPLGGLVMLVFLLDRGGAHDNRFGPPPV
jgi:uncharacterized membrane protein YhaH (DUF805 family)